MPKSKKPRKAYAPKDWAAERDRQTTETDRMMASPEPLKLNPNPPKSVPVDKEPPAPAHPHVLPHADAPRAPRGRGRYLVPVTAGAGVLGGAAYLTHRARRRKAEMAKGLIDPTTGDAVSYERAYIDDEVDKAVKFTGVGEMRGVAFKERARDRAVQGARKAKSAVTMERAGIASGGVLGGALIPRRNVDKAFGRKRSTAARKQADKLRKRHDETALEHHGSRRVGGRTPVSTVRVSGLPVSSATFSRGNPEARPGTRSHANALLHVHTNVKHHPRGKLVQIGHGRSKTPRPLKVTTSKSFGFAQSGGSGRRLINV